jgi:hypothetical protein
MKKSTEFWVSSHYTDSKEVVDTWRNDSKVASGEEKAMVPQERFDDKKPLLEEEIIHVTTNMPL